MKRTVFVLDSAVVPHASDARYEEEVLAGIADVKLLYLQGDADLEPYADSADGLILWHQVELGASLIKRLSKTRIIVRNGVGFEAVNCDAANEAGIPVSNVPDYGTEEVADHAMSLCLALTRRLKPLTGSVARGEWKWEPAAACQRIRGKIFGIIGCGRIGTATALRAKAFGYEVRFYDPFVTAGYEKAIGALREKSLAALLSVADVISLHAPLTAQTRHMIGEEQLTLMKPGALLINTARGPLVSFAAVERALAEERLGGAGLDVLEYEPLGAELAGRFANCIVTPHSALLQPGGDGGDAPVIGKDCRRGSIGRAIPEM